MSSNLEENCYGFASWCRKWYFSSVGCRKPNNFGKHCSKSFCKEHLKPLPQIALTSTSNCIHQEEGKYVIICINRFQMFATNISNSHSLSQSFLRAFRQAKLSTSFSQLRMAVTSDSKARPTDTAELRMKSSTVILVLVNKQCCRVITVLIRVLTFAFSLVSK